MAGIGEVHPIEGKHKKTYEILSSLWSRKDISIILITPDIEVSTKHAYSLFKTYKKINQKPILEAIQKHNIKYIASHIFNDFEPYIIKENPIIKEIKQDLLNNKVENSAFLR